MEYKFYSRKLKRNITFSRPASFYIYIDLNNEPGMLGKQLCEYGTLMGDTIGMSGDNENNFIQVCKNWWKNYLSKNRGILE